MKIEPFIHKCTVRKGSMAGNDYHQPVDRWDFEMSAKCDNCGEALATTDQLVAHIYDQLTTSET